MTAHGLRQLSGTVGSFAVTFVFLFHNGLILKYSVLFHFEGSNRGNYQKGRKGNYFLPYYSPLRTVSSVTQFEFSDSSSNPLV